MGRGDLLTKSLGKTGSQQEFVNHIQLHLDGRMPMLTKTSARSFPDKDLLTKVQVGIFIADVGGLTKTCHHIHASDSSFPHFPHQHPVVASATATQFTTVR
jgi:hypothetical protein